MMQGYGEDMYKRVMPKYQNGGNTGPGDDKKNKYSLDWSKAVEDVNTRNGKINEYINKDYIKKNRSDKSYISNDDIKSAGHSNWQDPFLPLRVAVEHIDPYSDNDINILKSDAEKWAKEKKIVGGPFEKELTIFNNDYIQYYVDNLISLKKSQHDENLALSDLERINEQQPLSSYLSNGYDYQKKFNNNQEKLRSSNFNVNDYMLNEKNSKEADSVYKHKKLLRKANESYEQSLRYKN